MPVIRLKDPRARIVTRWNGEDTPRPGKVGDTATVQSVPDYWLKDGRVEVVSQGEPERQFIVNPVPSEEPADDPAAQYQELTGKKPDGRWSDARLQEEIDKALAE